MANAKLNQNSSSNLTNSTFNNIDSKLRFNNNPFNSSSSSNLSQQRKPKQINRDYYYVPLSSLNKKLRKRYQFTTFNLENEYGSYGSLKPKVSDIF
jgi:hypothetical protein